MSELLPLLKMWRQAQSCGQSAALATVVRVRGSSYRRPGARLMTLANGSSQGLISGGCLENDVRARCQEALENNRCALVTYDSTSPQDIVWGLGLGCKGVVQVLVEPLKSAAATQVLALLEAGLEAGKCSALATIYAVESPQESLQVLVGERLLLRESEVLHDDIARNNAELGALLHADAQRALDEERSFNVSHVIEGARIEAFIEFVAPPLPLLLFGTGEDARPLASLARQLGWSVSVIDTRDGGLPVQFSDAHAIIKVRPEEIAARVPVSERAVAVIMTHNFLSDWEILKALLPSACRYIGLLGPRKRADELLERMEQRSLAPGVRIAPKQLQRLHAPIGLDIGAETPEEIALSIVAEIKAVLSQRDGRFLRERSAGIHSDAPDLEPASS